MKILITLSLIVVTSLSIIGQTKKKKTVKPTPATVGQKKPAAVIPVSLLTKQEQALLDEINLARANPTAYIPFLEEYRTYYNGKSVRFPDGRSLTTNEGVAALDEAIAYLRTLKSSQAFEVKKGMVFSAKLHLDDMQKSGRDGHLGSEGTVRLELVIDTVVEQYRALQSIDKTRADKLLKAINN